MTIQGGILHTVCVPWAIINRFDRKKREASDLARWKREREHDEYIRNRRGW